MLFIEVGSCYGIFQYMIISGQPELQKQREETLPLWSQGPSGKEREHFQWLLEDTLAKSCVFQQFTGSTIKLEEKCQVSFLRGQRLLPTLEHANIWTFVGFNCFMV